MTEGGAVAPHAEPGSLSLSYPPWLETGGPDAVPFVPDTKRPKRSNPLRAFRPPNTLPRTPCGLPNSVPADVGMLPKTPPDNRFLKRSKGLMPGSLAGAMLSRKFLIGSVMSNSLTGAGALGATVPPAGGDVLTGGQAENTTCGEATAPPRMIPIITNTQILCMLLFSFLLSFPWCCRSRGCCGYNFSKGCLPF